MKILYVEDNPYNLRLVGKMLRSANIEFLQAEDGRSGLAIATREHPDLILMDINLPDIDGTEVTGRIKADPELQHIPIIALTANAMFGDRERILMAGCDSYLAKPINRKELLDAIDVYLKIYEKSRQ